MGGEVNTPGEWIALTAIYGGIIVAVIVAVSVSITALLNTRDRRKCNHDNVRCIHGDEILHAGHKRVRCLDCGTALAENMPYICWYTGQPHGPGYQRYAEEIDD